MKWIFVTDRWSLTWHWCHTANSNSAELKRHHNSCCGVNIIVMTTGLRPSLDIDCSLISIIILHSVLNRNNEYGPDFQKYQGSHQSYVLIYLLLLINTTNTSKTFRHVHKHTVNKLVAPYLAINDTTKTASLLYKIIHRGSEGSYLQFQTALLTLVLSTCISFIIANCGSYIMHYQLKKSLCFGQHWLGPTTVFKHCSIKICSE